MNAVWSIVTFILGIVITWTLMNKYDTKMFDMWDTAYSIGKSDGFDLARAEFEVGPDELEFKCTFLYDAKGNVRVRK